MFTLAYEWNEMEYVGINEVDSVIANEDFQVEVPSIEPSFLWCINIKSMVPRSHVIWMNDIREALCYMLYAMVGTIWRRYDLCQILYLWWCMFISWHELSNQILKIHQLS